MLMTGDIYSTGPIIGIKKALVVEMSARDMKMPLTKVDIALDRVRGVGRRAGELRAIDAAAAGLGRSRGRSRRHMDAGSLRRLLHLDVGYAHGAEDVGPARRGRGALVELLERASVEHAEAAGRLVVGVGGRGGRCGVDGALLVLALLLPDAFVAEPARAVVAAVDLLGVAQVAAFVDRTGFTRDTWFL